MADLEFDEILEESGLYNRTQINGILSGKHYTRSIAAHKQFSEAPLCDAVMKITQRQRITLQIQFSL